MQAVNYFKCKFVSINVHLLKFPFVFSIFLYLLSHKTTDGTPINTDKELSIALNLCHSEPRAFVLLLSALIRVPSVVKEKLGFLLTLSNYIFFTNGLLRTPTYPCS